VDLTRNFDGQHQLDQPGPAELSRKRFWFKVDRIAAYTSANNQPSTARITRKS
jgi:hypothetical protein